MIIVLQRNASDAQVEEVVEELQRSGLGVRVLRAEKPLLHVVSGNTRAAKRCLGMEAVEALVPTSGPRVRREGRHFYPHHFIGWGAASLVLAALLVLLAGFLPPGLGRPVDPTSPPADVELPWYLAAPRNALDALPPWLAVLLVVLVVGPILFLPALDSLRARREGAGP